MGILITEIAQFDDINFYYKTRIGEEIYINGNLNHTVEEEIFITYKIKKTLYDFWNYRLYYLQSGYQISI